MASGTKKHAPLTAGGTSGKRLEKRTVTKTRRAGKSVRLGKSSDKAHKSDLMALFDDIQVMGQSVPIEEWKKLPADLNKNLDHYLYGSPKKCP
ncbi:MAG: hypothetical protein EHM48_00370 [Planctomycetaceae bacterium]|nr:MAG: hypothetical protein EHM48_00370 [Planctomycetaceae bacterium]